MVLKLYCLVDVKKPAEELNIVKDKLDYVYKLGKKLPKQIVLFLLGSWETIIDSFHSQAVLLVNLQLKNNNKFYIGRLSYQHRCLCWEGEWTFSKEDCPLGTDGYKIIVTVTSAEDALDSPSAGSMQSRTKKNHAAENGNKDNASVKRRSSNGSPTRDSKKKRTSSKRNCNMKQEVEDNSTSDNKENSLTFDSHSENIEETTSTLSVNSVKINVTECFNEGNIPTSRWGHTFSMLTDTTVVLMGGQGAQKNLRKDSLWLLDTETNGWSLLDNKSSSAARPDVRMGHAAAFDPTLHCIYVHGGSKNLRWFSDISTLDIDSWQWQSVEVKGKAPTRSYHSLTLYRHELWIFGGVYPQPQDKADMSSNDIHVYSLTNMNWYMPIVMGQKPLPRSGHSATLLGDQLVVFGGWDFPVVFNDLSVLDMRLVEWTQPKITGKPPPNRSWHASCALSNNRVLIHGGYNGNVALRDAYIFNLDALTWTEIDLVGSIEKLFRTGHAAFCIPYCHNNKEHDKVYIFGGGDNDEIYYNDTYHFTIPISC